MKCCYCKRNINKDTAKAINTNTNRHICMRCVVGLYGKMMIDFLEIAHAHPKKEERSKCTCTLSESKRG